MFDTLETLRQDLKTAKTLLVLGDNFGEVIIDSLLFRTDPSA